MKTREGFVSNSSSSSFVVAHKPFTFTDKNPKRLLKDSEIKKLKKHGFDFDGQNYVYSVSCNQDDVIELLLKEKISFKAECHYGHYHVFYDKDKNVVIEAYNYGCEADTYGIDHILEYVDNTDYPEEFKIPIKKFTRLGYLKEIKSDTTG